MDTKKGLEKKKEEEEEKGPLGWLGGGGAGDIIKKNIITSAAKIFNYFKINNSGSKSKIIIVYSTITSIMPWTMKNKNKQDPKI